jgi:hypothetical protein
MKREKRVVTKDKKRVTINVISTGEQEDQQKEGKIRSKEWVTLLC